MNAIQYAISQIHQTIPRPILERAFIKRTPGYYNTVSTNIDDEIMERVIRPVVLQDCNITGGVLAFIPLSGLQQERTSDSQFVIRIPKDRTQGRSIKSVRSIAFFDQTSMSAWAVNSSLGGYNQGYAAQNTAALAAAQAVVAAMDSIPITSTANCTLVGENAILVRDAFVMTPNCFLRCMLLNDERLSNIQMPSYLHFAELVEHAVKAYIYKELIIPIGQAELQGGAELGIFKSLVEGFADSRQNYKDFLRETWGQVAFLNDDQQVSRYLRMLVGSNR